MWSRDFLAGVNKPLKISEKKKQRLWSSLVTQPVSSGILNLYTISKYIMYKISMTVPMDRAKMEEVAEMLWMILIVAVLLDTREKIAVLVSHVLHVIE